MGTFGVILVDCPSFVTVLRTSDIRIHRFIVIFPVLCYKFPSWG